MSLKNSIIDPFSFNLLQKHTSKREYKKLSKRINKLFNGFSRETLYKVEMLSRIHDPDYNVNELPDYTITNRKIHIIRHEHQINKAIKEIINSEYIGFDTEQRPTFKRGEKQKPISIIQIATKESVYIFQMKYIKNINPVLDLMSSDHIQKIGFGLKNDIKEFQRQYNIEIKNLLDLSVLTKEVFNTKHPMGAKTAVAIFIGQKLKKSRKTVMSNWENNNLNDSQIKYASEDVTAPYDVYEILKCLSFT